tara:strand:- start:7951 stop:8589 length:639 start_codon:yes stop_codon:yes gene_type:complete
MNILKIIFTFLFMNLSFGQNFEGKWILTKNGDTYLVPKINVFEFKDGKLISSDLEKIIFSHNFKIIENEIFVENNYFGSFKFKNENRFTLFKKDEKDEKYEKRKLELDFVRLEKTETELNQKEIEKLTFEDTDYDLKIAFNVELQKPEILEILKRKATKKMLLKKIGKAYFIQNYEDGELDSVIPIRKVTSEYIEIYGFSRKEPYSLTIKRK